MERTRKRSRFRRTRRFYLVIFCAVCLYAGIAFIGQAQERGRIAKEHQLLKQQLQEAQMEKSKLGYLLENVNTDAYRETIAREKLGFVKDGETRYLPDADKNE